MFPPVLTKIQTSTAAIQSSKPPKLRSKKLQKQRFRRLETIFAYFASRKRFLPWILHVAEHEFSCCRPWILMLSTIDAQVVKRGRTGCRPWTLRLSNMDAQVVKRGRTGCRTWTHWLSNVDALVVERGRTGCQTWTHWLSNVDALVVKRGRTDCQTWTHWLSNMDALVVERGRSGCCVSAGNFTRIRGDLLCISMVVCGSNSGFQDICGWMEDSEGCR